MSTCTRVLLIEILSLSLGFLKLLISVLCVLSIGSRFHHFKPVSKKLPLIGTVSIINRPIWVLLLYWMKICWLCSNSSSGEERRLYDFLNIWQILSTLRPSGWWYMLDMNFEISVFPLCAGRDWSISSWIGIPVHSTRTNTCPSNRLGPRNCSRNLPSRVSTTPPQVNLSSHPPQLRIHVRNTRGIWGL